MGPPIIFSLLLGLCSCQWFITFDLGRVSRRVAVPMIMTGLYFVVKAVHLPCSWSAMLRLCVLVVKAVSMLMKGLYLLIRLCTCHVLSLPCC